MLEGMILWCVAVYAKAAQETPSKNKVAILLRLNMIVSWYAVGFK